MQIIQNCTSNKLKNRVLQKNMGLNEILSLERLMEIESVQAGNMLVKIINRK